MKKQKLSILLLLFFVFLSVQSANWENQSAFNSWCSYAQPYANPDNEIYGWVGYSGDQDWFDGSINKENILSVGLSFFQNIYYNCFPTYPYLCNSKIVDYDVLLASNGANGCSIEKIDCKRVGNELPALCKSYVSSENYAIKIYGKDPGKDFAPSSSWPYPATHYTALVQTSCNNGCAHPNGLCYSQGSFTDNNGSYCGVQGGQTHGQT